MYDTTTGVLTGLSNTGTGPANLATLSFNAQAQVSSVNFLTSTGGALAVDQFGYDGDLRPITATANWQTGSGNGTAAIFSQSRSFDPGGNMTSLSTTQAAVPGQSNSGGSETQNFCYDEQNRLVWAGNTGTQPGAGNGTCGSGTLSNTLAGASYSSSYAYTHLGQLWQGPLAGGSQYQYLYCSSSQPHQLTGLYPSGTTCSNLSGAVYTSGYDAWGNVTSRTYSSTTATLSYDLLDRFTKWYVSSTNQEQYVYDASGNRVLRRSTNSSGTTMTVYAFGLQEHLYSGSGTNQGNTYYYSLGGRLLGSLDANGTVFYMTDTLGSVLASFTNTANAASLKGNQVFGPYGNARDYQGTINTSKGFTGQYNDNLTGLDYYGSRYYDPVAGVFLSADGVLGNPSGDNPYAYVGGNPESFSDPTGAVAVSSCFAFCGGPEHLPPAQGPTSSSNGLTTPFPHLPGSSDSSGVNSLSSCGGVSQVDCMRLTWNTVTQVQGTVRIAVGGGSGCGGIGIGIGGIAIATAFPCMSPPSIVDATVSGTVVTPLPGCSSLLSCLTGSESVNDKSAEQEYEPLSQPKRVLVEGSVPAGEVGGACSFTSNTQVATEHGEQAIDTLKVGEKVWAYNPQMHKMELEPIQHVWLNHDNDLVDLTLTTTAPAQHGKVATKMSEVIHTNQKHPFFTEEKGFVPVGQIKLGMHVLRADGSYGEVTGWKVVPGISVMYNLTVVQDHTYTVGIGQWVVHNCAKPSVNHLDVVPYKTDVPSVYEKHHGVVDVWARNNISGYDRMQAPAIVLTVDEHMATRSYFAQWRIEQTGSLTGFIDWRAMPPQDIQALAYGMFDAAGVPGDAVQNYFQAFNQYIYGLP